MVKSSNNLTKQQQQESIVIPEIIKSLRKLGGSATTKEIKQDLLVRDTSISEETIMQTITSKKSGNTYRPFDYTFNFSITNLEMAGFLKRPRRGMVELTKAGRTLGLQQFDIQRSIFQNNESLWDERHQNNILKREVMAEDDVIDDEEKVASSWQDELLSALMKLSPAKFELFCRSLVKKMGVDLDENIGVKLSGDGGLDGYGYLTTDDFRTARVAIQAKRWSNLVSSPEIDKFRGAMDKHNAEFGIFITTAEFSRDAVKAARTGTRVITLINGTKLVELVAKYQLYVTEVTTYVLGDFFDEED